MDRSLFHPPKFEEFTLREKARVDQLHLKYGNNWKEIARRIPGRSALLIKTYWLKKQKNERILRAAAIAGKLSLSSSSSHQTDPFLWPLQRICSSSVNLSPLEILIMCADSEARF
jgi:hypothetical protein